MKAVALVSGGIDSPVAAALASQRYDVIAVHFCLYPFYCTGSFRSALAALKRLAQKFGIKSVLIQWSDVLTKIAKADRRYQCVLCRAAMLRVASLIARQNRAKVIVTGEVIGQKASQTLPNMAATAMMVDMPVLRPLTGLDKDHIITLSKQLGLWSAKHAGCCSATPENPILCADRKYLNRLWSELGMERLTRLCAKKRIRLTASESDILKRIMTK